MSHAAALLTLSCVRHLTGCSGRELRHTHSTHRRGCGASLTTVTDELPIVAAAQGCGGRLPDGPQGAH
jgi:hypothetical protein